MADIHLHNTLSGKIENFVPQKAGEVRMYTCGPTVYNYAHIGNYRTFVFQDILRRFLKLRGFKLHNVMNRSEEHTSELQSLAYLVCRLLLEKKKKDLNSCIVTHIGCAHETR